MKKLFIALLAFASTATVFAQKKIADVAKLNTETFDFGKVKQNVPPTATFVVTNISSEPLIIETANPTCGCTISDYTKSPIAPGKTGTIKATYNAATVGAIHKTLTVKFAGVDELKSINLAGEVLAPEAYDKWLAENKSGKGKEVSDKGTTATSKKVKKEKS
jgi:hypothetical protein